MKAEELFKVIKTLEKQRGLEVTCIWTTSTGGDGLLLHFDCIMSNGGNDLGSYRIDIDVEWPDETKRYPVKSVKYEPCRYCGIVLIDYSDCLLEHPHNPECPVTSSKYVLKSLWPVIKESSATEPGSKEAPEGYEWRDVCFVCKKSFPTNDMAITKDGLICYTCDHKSGEPDAVSIKDNLFKCTKCDGYGYGYGLDKENPKDNAKCPDCNGGWVAKKTK